MAVIRNDYPRFILNDPGMDLIDELKAFVATAQTGSFTAAAGQLGVQLMVMGAYGHSRVREFLFGGVTRYFLGEPTAPPLLLAH